MILSISPTHPMKVSCTEVVPNGGNNLEPPKKKSLKFLRAEETCLIDICTSSLFSNIRAVYFVVQYTMLPRIGNTDVMTDHMVMFCLMTKRRINLIRLILDYMLSAIDAARRSHAALPYGMLLTQLFMRAQFL